MTGLFGRRSVLWTIGLATVLAVAGTSSAGEAKKKRFMPKGDKTDDIPGAVWKWEAKETESGERKDGRFRVMDFVIYDLETRKVLGRIRPAPMQKDKTEIAFAESFALPGKVAATNTKLVKKKGITVWEGEYPSKGGTWRIKMQMIDQ